MKEKSIIQDLMKILWVPVVTAIIEWAVRTLLTKDLGSLDTSVAIVILAVPTISAIVVCIKRKYNIRKYCDYPERLFQQTIHSDSGGNSGRNNIIFISNSTVNIGTYLTNKGTQVMAKNITDCTEKATTLKTHNPEKSIQRIELQFKATSESKNKQKEKEKSKKKRKAKSNRKNK